MKFASRAAVFSTFILIVAAAPLSAQSWRWDVSLGGGYAWLSKFLDDGDVPGLGEDEVKYRGNGFVGATIGYWPSRNFGLRINGTYADPELRQTRNENGDDVADIEDVTLLDHVNLWGGTFDLMYRFVRPNETFDGTEVLPYITAGAGIKWTNPAGDSFFCVDEDTDELEETSCAPFVASGTTFALEERSTFLGLIGLGADWRFAKWFALRTEVGDRIWSAEARRFTSTGTDGGIVTDGLSNTMHEIYLQGGLTFLFGLRRAPEVVLIQPPPPPPPAPAPPPPPQPRRDAITVCVIDPASTGGIRMQSAILIEGRDTVISQNGADRPFRDALGNVLVASNADWYVRGQPLTLHVGSKNIEFSTYGSARSIEPSELAFLGTVNGIAAYADRSDVGEVIDELTELNNKRPGTDLGVLLNEHKELNRKLETVKLVYVPLYATGCVFQGVQRQEEVRKGK